MSDDLAHDAHLRAALRHAPDHALAPPSGLSQTILAAARQAHRPARPTPAPPPVRMHAARGRPWRAWLRRLFAPRFAGGWAAGLVATLGLGLWLDLEWQAAAERPTAVAMSSPTPESAAPAQAPPQATSAGPVAVDAAKAAPAELAKSVEPTDAVRKQRAAPARESRVAETAVVRRSETIDDTGQQRAAEDSSRGAAARQDRAPAEPAAPPAVAAAPAATDTAAERLALAGGRVEAPTAPATPAAPTAPTPATPGAESAAEPAPAPRAAVRSEAGLRAALPRAGQATLSEAATAASPASTLLRRTQAELAAGGTDWTWIPPGGVAMVPFDDAGRGWLSRVVQASRGRWVDAGERGESPDALEVRWWRDGWPHATLRVEAEGLRWIEAGRVRYAPLDAATLRQLRSL